MPLTTAELRLDPRSDDNDYVGDDEVLTFDEAAEHLKQLGEINESLKPRLTFEITFTPRRIDHDTPNFWSVYLDHKDIGWIIDGSYQDPTTGFWKRIGYEVYANHVALQTEAEAKALSSPNVHHIAFYDEHEWEDRKDLEYYDEIGEAYFPSFTTLAELITNHRERTEQ